MVWIHCIGHMNASVHQLHLAQDMDKDMDSSFLALVHQLHLAQDMDKIPMFWIHCTCYMNALIHQLHLAQDMDKDMDPSFLALVHQLHLAQDMDKDMDRPMYWIHCTCYMVGLDIDQDMDQKDPEARVQDTVLQLFDL
ncbi:uncharacterized protein LOC122625863 [Drosophila teissieri]|uniref:uncharacterized protein LOC122625863 n=1 Tax=Drosophila teissieri TaxID=7243 RepID=UPI001CBA30E1|nr:uncharacterized protein LOC122625863 [Drosophila teissieri]